ncbi:hypothetical protein ABVT39_003306 [Epinephelus coioides]
MNGFESSAETLYRLSQLLKQIGSRSKEPGEDDANTASLEDSNGNRYQAAATTWTTCVSIRAPQPSRDSHLLTCSPAHLLTCPTPHHLSPSPTPTPMRRRPPSGPTVTLRRMEVTRWRRRVS